MNQIKVNEKCLAYHGPMLYEAKILKVYSLKLKKISNGDGDDTTFSIDTIPEALLQQPFAYFIHYKGWNSKWDEWVGEERVLEFSEQNIILQNQLKESIRAASSKKKISTKNTNSGTTSLNNSKLSIVSESAQASINGLKKDSNTENDFNNKSKRKRNFESIEKINNYNKKPEIHLTINSSLKTLLVNDWENITKNRQLVPLPRSPSVVDILSMFKENYLKNLDHIPTNTEEEILDEVLSGIKVYFDTALGHILLYRFERHQYKLLIHKKEYKDKDPSHIYGAEHLLRLFSSIPAFLTQTNMDQQSVGVLTLHLEAFILFLANNIDELFIKKYNNTTPLYDALSRS